MKASTSQSSRVGDGPGGNSSKLPPMIGGVCLTLLFYSFVAAAIIFLVFWLAVELVAGFLGGRFRWGFRVRQAFRIHFALEGVFLRSLRLRNVVEDFVALAPEDAPELFSMLEPLCLQTGIHFPPEVFVEMEAVAWVRLKGGVALGLGYDLLAGTTRAELEAVIAHELSHAKLTQRLVRNWLARGLERAVQLSRGLSHLTAPRREKVKFSRLARVFLRVSDNLAEAAAQRTAAFSRQEEFEADRGAAEISGAAKVRGGLLKVEALARFAARLSWRDRISHLQAQTFSHWLVKELAVVQPLQLQQVEARVADRYSTHPSLRDRLDALSSSREILAEPDKRPAIKLLVEPDGVAERLIGKIVASSVEREERDSRKLRRWARAMRVATEMRPVQKVGATLVVAAEIAAVVAWIIGAEFEAVAAIFGTAVVGVLLYSLGQYREKFSLPVPDFGLLKETWHTGRSVPEEEIKDLGEAIRARVAGRTGPRAEAVLAAKSFEKLTEGDYARAGVAARMLLERNPQSMPGLLVSAVTSAWLGNGEAMAGALAIIQETAGLRGPSICWGVAWTCLLRGNWTRAEALLEQVIDSNPGHPTLLNLRALCQLRRGKIQSAIISARRACEPEPLNREHAKFLIDLLLEGGYLTEARARLLPLDRDIPHDHDLMLGAIRLDLSSRNFEAANRWAEALLRSSPPAHMIVQLAAHYELARQLDQAGRFYREALALAFYPDACLGLARLEAERRNAAAARRHTLEALNFRKPLGKHATPPLELLRPALTQLALLEPPSPSARAWIAELADTALPTALAGVSFVVFASNQAQAEGYFLSVIEAMSGGGARVVVSEITWRLAPPEHQPFGPVQPGVQPLLEGAATSPFRGFQRHGLWQPRHNRIQSIIDGMRLLPQLA
jgi:Zn-dependent protease with chaperone function/tetratricopeptide (TPR) repeat protein